ncbi:hypothetical protein [Criblamydia sequanensis]|uniref:Conserved putative secreted protein n=1 Tax=Candidatus Criblamydia sequanensis CRIB-18 TaxID=1437425 RepID=A0A090CXQ7_9BACT|nr:hypothetical protein [Criblamydia sequanensis]CDR32877.1 Conserved putative secreted protein [Criblamydia sequanensis CRIB-18]
MKLIQKFVLFTMGIGMLFGLKSEAQADWYSYGYDGCCYEGPLTPCSFGVGIRGGVAPTWFTDRGDNLIIGPVAPIGVLDEFSVVKFNDAFDTPWTISAELGYAFSDHVELFFEGAYTHASGKTHEVDFDFVPGFPLTASFGFDNYSDWALYAGARYHFTGCDLCGCRVWPFLGAKLGAKFYDKVKYDVDFTFTSIVPPLVIEFEDSFTVYKRQTVPSIGAQLGFEAKFSNCFSFVFMVEALWSGCFKPNESILIPSPVTTPDILAEVLSPGHTGPLFQLPITVGFNWFF